MGSVYESLGSVGVVKIGFDSNFMCVAILLGALY
jgi:hypothetical protein